MGPRGIRPESPEESLIHWTIVSTWGLWLLGALYLVGPILGYGLLALLALRWLGLLGGGPQDVAVPLGIWLWIAGMAAMLVALVIAHLEFDLGLLQTLKSSIGWAKGWALLAIFPLIGATMAIRPAVVYRATGLLAAQTLILAPFFWLAGVTGFVDKLYVSPLSVLGGVGSEFFDVTLYAIDDTNQKLRWRFFAPWATAAAFLAGISLVFAIYERSRLWQVVGIASVVVICQMTDSRLSLVAIPVILAGILVLPNVTRPAVLAAIGVLATLAVLLSEPILIAYEDMNEAFTAARAASSRVRSSLAAMAYHRWITDAPIFGHGIIERGPHLVEFMPIGSHHTWHGVLFVKGAVGFVALALPLGWTILELAVKAQADRVARAGLGVAVALLMFSFGDNLEIVAYLIWPGLVVMGIALRRRFRNPLAARLGAAVHAQLVLQEPRQGLQASGRTGFR